MRHLMIEGDQKIMLIKIFHLLGQWSIAFVSKMKLDCVLVQRKISLLQAEIGSNA